MQSYKTYSCPGCESSFRVVFPDPVPSHYANQSKIKLKCSTCGEVREPYAFVLDRIMQAPEPGIPSIAAMEISLPDMNPPANVRITWLQEVFKRRAARFRAMYGN
jgi:hypothetical protein